MLILLEQAIKVDERAGNLASPASNDTGLTVRGPEQRSGQHMKRNLLSFLIACNEVREHICASMALISFSPIIVIVATPIRFDWKVTTWSTFRTNVAGSNPGEAQ